MNIDFTKGDFEFENEPAIKGNQFNTFYPIIGAGTYANSHFAGVSCTGHGEYFIKNVEPKLTNNE